MSTSSFSSGTSSGTAPRVQNYLQTQQSLHIFKNEIYEMPYAFWHMFSWFLTKRWWELSIILKLLLFWHAIDGIWTFYSLNRLLVSLYLARMTQLSLHERKLESMNHLYFLSSDLQMRSQESAVCSELDSRPPTKWKCWFYWHLISRIPWWQKVYIEYFWMNEWMKKYMKVANKSRI